MTLAPLQLMGDERLAQMAVRGDRRAFDVLFERHRRGLQHCARSIVGNEHDAQDALQTAALKAFVGLAGRISGAPLRHVQRGDQRAAAAARTRPRSSRTSSPTRSAGRRSCCSCARTCASCSWTSST